ncbi:6708_t:CDS:2 [Funneliformis mosseae]|uniref:6708_t:CDS:1 n=1 Tax=Funneliformis mosseae TaxID=27381 RepID=A0A9N9CU00_FUNMO|nr:6708_t:CDS:2 [Funneliformis mosseae]
MIHFFVNVNEGQKNIIGQQIIKVAEDNYLKEGLYDKISLILELELKYIQFIKQTKEPDDPPQLIQLAR